MKEKIKQQSNSNWINYFIRKIDWIIIVRTPEWCVTHWWMKFAYRDHTTREIVMVAWPFNYLVQIAWMINLAWSRYRHRKSWIDKEVEKRIASFNIKVKENNE